MKKYVFIGSSPITLLKAYLLSKKDANCTIYIYDKSKEIGGAWYSEVSPKNHKIECGCHIWSYTPKAYKFLEREFNLKLKKIKPNALFVGKNIKIPYSFKNTITTYKFVFKSMITLKWAKLKILQNSPQYNLKLFGKRNKYPLKGSPELTNVLLQKLAKNPKITINTECAINTIVFGEQNKIIGKGIEKPLDEAFVTSVSEIETIQLKDSTIKIESEKIDYIHFLVRLNKPLLKKMFYWRLISDSVIHRISDISYQTNFEENLLLIGIKENAYQTSNENSLFAHCIDVLKNYKLINEDFEIELIKTHVFPTYYIDEKVRKAINKVDGLTLMHSTDLMYGIYHLLT